MSEATNMPREPLYASLPASGVSEAVAVAEDAWTALWLREGDRWGPPPDVGHIAGVFAQTVCGYRPQMAVELACQVRHTAAYPPVAVAEAILRYVDVPADSPAGATLDDAFEKLRWAMSLDPARPLAVRDCARMAVQLAAEAIWVWDLGQPQVRINHPACPNNPVTILARAREHLAARESR